VEFIWDFRVLIAVVDGVREDIHFHLKYFEIRLKKKSKILFE